MKRILILITTLCVALSSGAFAENTPSDNTATNVPTQTQADPSATTHQDEATTKSTKHKKHIKKHHHNTKTC